MNSSLHHKVKFLFRPPHKIGVHPQIFTIRMMSTPRRVPLALIVTAFILCSSRGTMPQNSGMFRNDLQHSGLYSGGVPEFHGTKWIFRTHGEVNSSPVVANGVVFVGSNDGSLYAIDQETGSERWAFPSKSRIPSSPAIENGLVYFNSYDGFFYAIDAADGKLRWKFANPKERRFAATHLHGSLPIGETMPDPFDVYLSSPAIWNGTVYFGSGDGNVYAVDAADGSLKWKFPTGDVVHSSPVVLNGIVYIGSWDSYFYALDAKSGQQIWRFETGKDDIIHNQVGIQSSATVSDGVVYFGCRDSNLYALDAATGRKLWSFSNNGSWVITSPLVYRNAVYFATSDSALVYELDAKTGKSLRSAKFAWPFFGSPSIAAGILYLAGQDGKVVALDAASLRHLWTFQSEGSQRNLAALSNADGSPDYETSFVSSFYDDTVIGVNKMRSVGMFLSSPVISGRVLYIGSTDGNLYALQ